MKQLLYITMAVILLISSPLFLKQANAQESKNEIKKPIVSQSRDTLWAKDTLGCLGYRNNQASIIEDNKEQYLGKSESEIKEIFGEPTHAKYYCNESRFNYYLAVSPDCEYIYSEKLSWNDIEAGTSLEFIFNKEGKLTGIVSWFH